jgi:AcrR family transcriptional regulator
VVADVKRKMIRETALSLARRGLQRTSFSEILAASGAPRGSLYHHFPGGKDELVLAALEAAGDYALGAIERSAGMSAVDVAQTFASLWRSVLAGSDFRAGCAIVAVTVAAETPELVAHAAAVFRGWRTRLAARLAAGGVPEAKSGALSVSLIAALEGAVVLARAERSFEPFDLVASAQMEAIRAAMTAPADSSAKPA